MEPLDTARDIRPRVISAQIAELSRLMVNELANQYEYLATRIVTTPHQIITARILKDHLKNATIDPDLIFQLKNVGDDTTQDLLETIQHLVLMTPLSVKCCFSRYSPIVEATALLQKFRDECFEKSVGSDHVMDMHFSAAKLQLHADLSVIADALSAPGTAVIFSTTAIKNMRLRAAYSAFSNGDRLTNEAGGDESFNVTSAYGHILDTSNASVEDEDANSMLVDDIASSEAFASFTSSLMTDHPSHFPSVESVERHFFISDGNTFKIEHPLRAVGPETAPRLTEIPLINIATPSIPLATEWYPTEVRNGCVRHNVDAATWASFSERERMSNVAYRADMSTLAYLTKLQSIRHLILWPLFSDISSNDPTKLFFKHDANRACSFTDVAPLFDYDFDAEDLPPVSTSTIPQCRLRLFQLVDATLAFMLDMHVRCLPVETLAKFTSSLADIAASLPYDPADPASQRFTLDLDHASPSIMFESEEEVRRRFIMFSANARVMTFYVLGGGGDVFMDFAEMLAWCEDNKAGKDAKSINAFLSRLVVEGPSWQIPISAIPSSLLVALPPLPQRPNMDSFVDYTGDDHAAEENESSPVNSPLGPLWGAVPACFYISSGVGALVASAVKSEDGAVSMPYLRSIAPSLTGFAHPETLVSNRLICAERFELDPVTQVSRLLLGLRGDRLTFDPNVMDSALKQDSGVEMFEGGFFPPIEPLSEILGEARIRCGLDERDLFDGSHHPSSSGYSRESFYDLSRDASPPKEQPIALACWPRMQNLLTACVAYVVQDVYRSRSLWLYSRLGIHNPAAIQSSVDDYSADFHADLFVMCIQQLVTHVGPAASKDLQALVLSKLPTRDDAKKAATKFREVCGPGVAYCTDYAKSLSKLRVEVEFWEAENLRVPRSSPAFKADHDDPDVCFDISRRYQEPDKSMTLDSLIAPLIDAVFHNRIVGYHSSVNEITQSYVTEVDDVVQHQLTSGIGFAQTLLKCRSEGTALSAIIGVLPTADEFVRRELLFEDALPETASAMSSLCEVFSGMEQITKQGNHENLTLEQWLFIALGRESQVDARIRSSKWFDIPRFKRRLYCAFWYADVRSVTDERVGDWSGWKRSIHSNNMVTREQALAMKIAMAPMSCCRMPSLLTLEGPLGNAFDTIVSTLTACDSVASTMSSISNFTPQILENMTGVTIGNDGYGRWTLGGDEGSALFRKTVSDIVGRVGGDTRRSKLTTLAAALANMMRANQSKEPSFVSIITDASSRGTSGGLVRQNDAKCGQSASMFMIGFREVMMYTDISVRTAELFIDRGGAEGGLYVFTPGPMIMSRGIAQLSFMNRILGPIESSLLMNEADGIIQKVLSGIQLLPALGVTDLDDDHIRAMNRSIRGIVSQVTGMSDGGDMVEHALSAEDGKYLCEMYHQLLREDDAARMPEIGLD